MSDGPFKMRGYTYPGEAPAKSPNKFSWKRFKKTFKESGGPFTGIFSIGKAIKAGNQQLKGFDTSEDDSPTFEDPRRENLLATKGTSGVTSETDISHPTVDNPADDVTIENELANVSNEEKDEIIKKVVKEQSGASEEGLNV